MPFWDTSLSATLFPIRTLMPPGKPFNHRSPTAETPSLPWLQKWWDPSCRAPSPIWSSATAPVGCVICHRMCHLSQISVSFVTNLSAICGWAAARPCRRALGDGMAAASLCRPLCQNQNCPLSKPPEHPKAEQERSCYLRCSIRFAEGRDYSWVLNQSLYFYI